MLSTYILNHLGNGAGRAESTPDELASIYLGIGSNYGDRLANLRTAISLMQPAGIRVVRISSVYETDPVGPPQPVYLNAVCSVETELSPRTLLAAVKKIEVEAGRVPRQRWGPREIDIDILLYGNRVVESADLSIPHRELLNRPFVLIPLLEIAPDAMLPGGESLADFAPKEQAGVRRYKEQYL